MTSEDTLLRTICLVCLCVFVQSLAQGFTSMGLETLGTCRQKTRVSLTDSNLYAVLHGVSACVPKNATELPTKWTKGIRIALELYTGNSSSTSFFMLLIFDHGCRSPHIRGMDKRNWPSVWCLPGSAPTASTAPTASASPVCAAFIIVHV